MGQFFNGLTVKRRGNTIFIPLPKSEQMPCDGCSCLYCKAHPGQVPMWDTVAVSVLSQSRYTWVVHAPEMHTDTRKG